MLKNKFGIIRDIREKKGLTLVELSQKTEITYSYIAALERGDKTNPSIETLTKIAIALGVNVSDLIEVPA